MLNRRIPLKKPILSFAIASSVFYVVYFVVNMFFILGGGFDFSKVANGAIALVLDYLPELLFILYIAFLYKKPYTNWIVPAVLGYFALVGLALFRGYFPISMTEEASMVINMISDVVFIITFALAAVLFIFSRSIKLPVIIGASVKILLNLWNIIYRIYTSLTVPSMGIIGGSLLHTYVKISLYASALSSIAFYSALILFALSGYNPHMVLDEN